MPQGHDTGKSFAQSNGFDHEGKTPQDNNRITFDSPGVVDESGPNLPKVPPRPAQPVLPIDDAFKKYRTETT